MDKVAKLIAKFEGRIGKRVYIKSEEAFGNITDFILCTDGDKNINSGVVVLYKVSFPFEEVTVHESDVILFLQ